MKVSLDDVVDEASKPRKAKVVEHGEGTFDKDALYKEMDQSGGFVKDISGALEPESFLKLRRIIVYQVQAAFKEKRTQFMMERVALLKENRMEEYYAVMDKTASTYHAIDYQVTKLASQFIDIDEEHY